MDGVRTYPRGGNGTCRGVATERDISTDLLKMPHLDNTTNAHQGEKNSSVSSVDLAFASVMDTHSSGSIPATAPQRMPVTETRSCQASRRPPNVGSITPKGSRRSRSSVPVLIWGLPNSLCNAACMEVVLENAGLEGCFVRCHARPGTSYGEAVVYITTLRWAHHCVNQFHGRIWDSTGMPVHAKVLDSDWSAQSLADYQDSGIHACASSAELTRTDELATGIMQRHFPQPPSLVVPSVGTSPCSTKMSSPTCCKKGIAWADVINDEEETTCSGTNDEENGTEVCFDVMDNIDDGSSMTAGASDDTVEQLSSRAALDVPFAKQDRYGDFVHISTGLKFSTKRTFIEFLLPSTSVAPTAIRRVHSVSLPVVLAHREY